MRADDNVNKSDDPAVPTGPMVLGIAGLIPFMGTTAVAVFGEPGISEIATFALLAYGAIILSFLGGILWGSVLARGHAGTPINNIRLLVSVAPSLIGWAALQAGPGTGIPVLAVAFLLVLVIDLANTRDGILPPWYPRLRMPLTSAVVVLLMTPVML